MNPAAELLRDKWFAGKALLLPLLLLLLLSPFGSGFVHPSRQGGLVWSVGDLSSARGRDEGMGLVGDDDACWG